MPEDDGIEANVLADADMNANAAAPSRGQRSATRLAAVQALYQIDVADASPEEVLQGFKGESWSKADPDLELPAPDEQLLEDLVMGVFGQQPSVDAALDAALDVGHSIERLEVLLRAVLRAGAYELKPLSSVPSKVVINEYVDLAHAFFAGKEPALVNAVLDRLAHSLGPADKTQDKTDGR